MFDIDWIKTNINPPLMHLPGRLKVYTIISKVFTTVFNDFKLIFNNFFPQTADEKNLEKHRKALSIPKFSHDTTETIRYRVSHAGSYYQNMGMRCGVMELLESTFSGRFRIFDFATEGLRLGYSRLSREGARLGTKFRLIIQVLNLTSDELSYIYMMLDKVLNPGIEICIVRKENI